MAIAQSTPAKAKKMTVASVMKQIEPEKIRWVDLQFVDVLGTLQHITIPATSHATDEYKRGARKLGGSSLKGRKELHEWNLVRPPYRPTSELLRADEGAH